MLASRMMQTQHNPANSRHTYTANPPFLVVCPQAHQ